MNLTVNSWVTRQAFIFAAPCPNVAFRWATGLAFEERPIGYDNARLCLKWGRIVDALNVAIVRSSPNVASVTSTPNGPQSFPISCALWQAQCGRCNGASGSFAQTSYIRDPVSKSGTLWCWRK